MRILCYGAGAIGSLYAAKLAEAGHDVSVLARGPRLSELRSGGIALEDGVTGRRSRVSVRAVEALEPSDAYDLVLVVLAKYHLGAVFPRLAANHRTPNVLFMCQNAAGPAFMVDAVGRERPILGFPGAAAVRTGDAFRYLILSRREQPTTVGDLEGHATSRPRWITAAFEEAGFPSVVCPRMDAWLKTHAAEIAPTAGALYMAGGSMERLSASRPALDLMIRAIRENYRVLAARGIPITPRMHSLFKWLPASLLRRIIGREALSDTAKIKVGHVAEAAKEMKLLATELRELAGMTATPAMDELRRHIDAAAAPSE